VISINATLFVQLINFLLIMYILNRILFKPILKTLSERDNLIQGAKAEATELKLKSEEKLSEYNQALEDARQKATESHGQIRKEALAAADDMIHSAMAEEQRIISEIKQEIESEAIEAREELKARAVTISNDVTQKILGRVL
jgi:F-type H+-transporting ATPase subunit b